MNDQFLTDTPDQKRIYADWLEENGRELESNEMRQQAYAQEFCELVKTGKLDSVLALVYSAITNRVVISNWKARAEFSAGNIASGTTMYARLDGTVSNVPDPNLTIYEQRILGLAMTPNEVRLGK